MSGSAIANGHDAGIDEDEKLAQLLQAQFDKEAEEQRARTTSRARPAQNRQPPPAKRATGGRGRKFGKKTEEEEEYKVPLAEFLNKPALPKQNKEKKRRNRSRPNNFAKRAGANTERGAGSNACEIRIVRSLLDCVLSALGEAALELDQTISRAAQKSRRQGEDSDSEEEEQLARVNREDSFAYSPADVFSALQFFFGYYDCYPNDDANLKLLVNAWKLLRMHEDLRLTAVSDADRREKALRAAESLRSAVAKWKRTEWSAYEEEHIIQSSVFGVHVLPLEIVEKIFVYLDVPTILRCAEVCSTWKYFVRENQHLWQTIYGMHYKIRKRRTPRGYVNPLSDNSSSDEEIDDWRAEFLCRHYGKDVSDPQSMTPVAPLNDGVPRSRRKNWSNRKDVKMDAKRLQDVRKQRKKSERKEERMKSRDAARRDKHKSRHDCKND